MSARSINRTELIGNVGISETRPMPNGGQVTTVSLATTESWKDKNTGEWRERTEWHRVKFFGPLAEVAAEYCVKGKQIYVEARLKYDKYVDKEGIERYSTDLIAKELILLGGGSANRSDDRSQAPARPARAPERQNPPRSNGSSRPAPSRAQHNDAFAGADPGRDPFDDDDIPL